MAFPLDDRQRRELWGLLLLLLAALLALSLIPGPVLRSAGPDTAAGGNLVGAVGAWLERGAWRVLGFPALLLPAFAALWGVVAFGRVPVGTALRWTLLLAGVTLILPAGLAALAHPLGAGAPRAAGWVGAAVGGVLVAGFGWVGAALLLLFLFAALCVATLGWNPLRSALGSGRAAWGGTRRLATVLPLPALGRRADAGAADAVADAYDAIEEIEPAPLRPRAAVAAALAAEGDDEATLAEAAIPVVPARNGGSARASSRRAAEPAPEPVLPDPGDPAAADLPPTALLAAPAARNEARDRQELDALGQVLVDKLATFKIAGEIVGMTTGPVVTQFEVAPAPGIKVSRIASLESDLALAMRAPSIRIIAPIPGKGAVGVEVPNPAPEIVAFREVLESAQFRGSRAQLPIALGKDISGRPYVADLAKTPHLLIAGATGSGKSVCVNTIITSLVYRHSPQSLRLLMVDPKMVELSMYNDLPHLRHPVVTDNNEAAGVLKWAVLEMERRYALLSANGVRNLQDFNKRVDEGQVMRSPEPVGEEGDPDRWIYQDGKLPYIVLIIDELADLMMTVQGDVEKPLALLAQKARAIGIHLILATQRPSVNVITGLIKANFPSRIAFRVSSKVDSRTILDQNGADALLGNGDMLFLPPGQSDPTRIQGAYISTEDTEQLMAWYRARKAERAEAHAASEPDILDLVRAREGEGDGAGERDDVMEERDKLFHEAALLCIQHQGGSTSLLQRRLKIGYGRAARIIDQLHFAGVLGPPDGSKPREVLVDIVGLEQICPSD